MSGPSLKEIWLARTFDPSSLLLLVFFHVANHCSNHPADHPVFHGEERPAGVIREIQGRGAGPIVGAVVRTSSGSGMWNVRREGGRLFPSAG